MENYDLNIRWGTHTIKVSFQYCDYKGFITFKRGGNCKGLDVLTIDEDDLFDSPLSDNPIKFELLSTDDEGNEWFKMELKNEKGDLLLVEDEWNYLSSYIVGIEIIDFIGGDNNEQQNHQLSKRATS